MSVPRVANVFLPSRSAYFSGTDVAMGTSKRSIPAEPCSKTLPLRGASVHRRKHPAIEDARGVHAGGLAENHGQFFGAKSAAVAVAPVHQVAQGVAQGLLAFRLRADAVVHFRGQ